MIPGLSIKAGPLATDVSIEAGVVNNTLDINDTPTPSTEALVPGTEELKPICNETCLKMTPLQLENHSVITLPTPTAVPPKNVSPDPAITIKSKQVKKTKKTKKTPNVPPKKAAPLTKVEQSAQAKTKKKTK